MSDTNHAATDAVDVTADAGDDTATDTWSMQPFLGLVPHFHTDPVAGVPLVSTDGHWWWDGYAWTPTPVAV